MPSFLDHPHETIPMVHYYGEWFSIEKRTDMPSIADYTHVTTAASIINTKSTLAKADAPLLSLHNPKSSQPLMAFRLVDDQLVIEGDISHADEAARIMFYLVKNMVDQYIEQRLNNVNDKT